MVRMEVVCHSYCLDVLAGKPEKMAAMQETNTSIAYNLHLTLEHKILSFVMQSVSDRVYTQLGCNHFLFSFDLWQDLYLTPRSNLEDEPEENENILTDSEQDTWMPSYLS